jgi:hypothetical protein
MIPNTNQTGAVKRSKTKIKVIAVIKNKTTEPIIVMSISFIYKLLKSKTMQRKTRRQ